MADKKVIYIVVVLVVVAALAVLFSGITGLTVNVRIKGDAQSTQSYVASGINVGNKAPEFSVATIDGKLAQLSDLDKRDIPAFLYFTASWCPFCRQELLQLKSIYPEYQNKILFLAVSIDPNDNEQILNNWKIQNGFPYEFAKGDINMLVTYDAKSLGTKYGIDKDATITFKEIRRGGMTAQDWRNALNSML